MTPGLLRKHHSVSKLVVHLIFTTKYNTHLQMQSKTGLLWSSHYFACSAGEATIETLRAYVQGLSTPD
ncbi:transposase [Escherichia coli]|nr:transposase [Escherichia coli]EGA7217670.1 hypothetical protein [Shigella sonnei]EAC1377932.1 hypothetical protein [Escherichia coli]EEQ2125232.1 hypothetical protein [Escherichia coli]EEQ3744658.1 hypothetical protein [Escherichia coli]EES0675415.1 hypothetical protein [Escherichia coli]